MIIMLGNMDVPFKYQPAPHSHVVISDFRYLQKFLVYYLYLLSVSLDVSCPNDLIVYNSSSTVNKATLTSPYISTDDLYNIN